MENRLEESTARIKSLSTDLETVRQEAITDGLTGIANRKHFDAVFTAAADEAQETGEDLCLLVLDIDHFKKFNDTYGHQVGDQVLKLLAMTLTESIKGRDTAARYGGEEFVVVLPATTLDNAVTVADNIRERVVKKAVVNRKTGKNLGSISVSIGVGRYAPGESPAETVARADQALYVAKKCGRNRVVREADYSEEPTAEAK